MPDPRYENRTRDLEKSIQETTGIYWESIDLAKRGLERTIETQRQFLDIADQQNADAANLWRQMFGNIPGVETFCDIAEQTMDQFIQFQRKTLDAIGQTSGQMAEGAKQQGERGARMARETVESADRQQREQREQREQRDRDRERIKSA